MVDVLASVTTLYVVSVLFTLGATTLAARAGSGPSARLFVIAGAAATVWTLGALAQLFLRGPAQIGAFLATWILRWVAVFAWLFFVMEYTGREWRRPAVLGPSLVTFLVAAALIATSGLHDFVFSGLTVARAPTPHVTFTREIGFGLLAIPAFLIVGYVFVALGRVALATRRESRRQALALAGGLVVPAAIAVAQTTGSLPFPWVRYATLGNCFQMVGVAYGVFGGGLFRFRPISRNAVMEAIDDPIVVTDGDRVADYNDAAARLFPGLAAGERLADAAPQLVADETVGERGSADGKETTDEGETTDDTTDAGESATETTVGRVATATDELPELVAEVETTVDGERRTLVVSVDPVTGGRVIICRDVTAVESYAAELERQTEQLDRFASVVSHDLRNPLTVAEGYLEMAATQTDDETVGDHLDRVASAHERMGRLIDDTLTLARQGSVVDETQHVPLAEAAREAWAYVESDGRLDADPVEGHVVEADPDRLQSAFENLFRNAVEHGGPAVTVTVHPTPDGFAVADDGPGVPEADRNAIFDEGFTTDDDGTGFGLAIVRSIATAHGGDVRVTDSADGGARFELSGFGVVEDTAETAAGRFGSVAGENDDRPANDGRPADDDRPSDGTRSDETTDAEPSRPTRRARGGNRNG